MVFVKPIGPHHCATCLGSVHALNTSSRGASKTRVRTISRSAVLFATRLLAFMLLILSTQLQGKRSRSPGLPRDGPAFRSSLGKLQCVSQSTRARFDAR